MTSVTYLVDGVGDGPRRQLTGQSEFRPAVSVRGTSIVVPGRHGSIPAGPILLEPSTLTLEWEVWGETVTQMEDERAALISLLSHPSGVRITRRLDANPATDQVVDARLKSIGASTAQYATPLAVVPAVFEIPAGLWRSDVVDSTLNVPGAVPGLTGSTGPVGDAVLRVKDPDDFELTDVVSGTGVSWSGSLPGWYLYIDTATLRAWLSESAAAWAGGSSGTVVRTNLVTNPRPALSTAGWRISGGETLTYIANDGGKPCLEARDAVGGGGTYADPDVNFTPQLGQWIATAYDVRALDAPTAAAMRLRLQGYSGTTASTATIARPVTTGGFTRITNVGQVTAYDPAGYVRALLWPDAVPAPSAFRFREVSVAIATTEAAALAAVSTFFDGNTPDTPLVTNDWTGPANASASTQTIDLGKATSLLDFPAAGRLQLWPRMPGADPAERTARVTFTGASEVVVRARPAYL